VCLLKYVHMCVSGVHECVCVCVFVCMSKFEASIFFIVFENAFVVCMSVCKN
jgi:hypothetical protein